MLFYLIITFFLPFVGIWLYRYYGDKNMLKHSIMSSISWILLMFDIYIGIAMLLVSLIFIVLDDCTKSI